MKGFILGFLEGRDIKEDTFIEEEDKVEEDSPLDLIVHFFEGHHNTVPLSSEPIFTNSFSSRWEIANGKSIQRLYLFGRF